jgi:hypothetical protein
MAACIGSERTMSEEPVIKPMTEDFILWRCLHSGPLSGDNIEKWPSGAGIPWESLRSRNIPLLRELTRLYGACAILARAGGEVIGQLRFYPKAVCGMEAAGSLCLQQEYPAGPAGHLDPGTFPSIAQIDDKTLIVHCLMTGSPQRKVNPHIRKGIGSRMVRTLIGWARDRGWEGIEADSFEDLPIIYKNTGSAGRTFWEKLGFHVLDRHPHPDLQDYPEFVALLDEQARRMGIPPERARDRIVMRLDLL